MAKLSPDQLDPRNALELYTKDVIKNSEIWTEQLLRSEYSRLRSIAQKRLVTLAKYEPESYAYKKNVGQYPPARGTSTEEIARMLPKLAKFIAAKTGSVTGIRAQRAKAVATMRKHEYDFITLANYQEFASFMEAWRDSDKGKKKTWGSDDVVTAFQWTYEHGIRVEEVKDNFARYLRQQKNLERYVKQQNKRGKEVTSAMIMDKFEELELAREKRLADAKAKRAEKRAAKKAGS